MSEVIGLTHAEVQNRIKCGQTNAHIDVKTKSVSQIFKEHLLTLFNLINFLLFVLVLCAGELKNGLFIGIVLANLVIGISQEIQAKLMVDKLSILSAQKVPCFREGSLVSLDPQDLVLDDVILLSHGDQVPADCVVLSGEALVDESLLTGESNQIAKSEGSQLLSGSFVGSGSVYARVDKVGLDGFAAQINAEAKQIKPSTSQIMKTVRFIIRLATILLIPLGIALLVRTLSLHGVRGTELWNIATTWGRGGSAELLNDAILTSVAAVLGMIPQGLVLLVSSVLSIATIRLGRKQVLIQKPACIETLARVHVLCLDKTGTLTTGSMTCDALVSCGEYTQEEVQQLVASLVYARTDDANDTDKALIEALQDYRHSCMQPDEVYPFDSAKKYSGARFAGRTYVMGAPSFILHSEDLPQFEALRAQFPPRSRLLAVIETDQIDSDNNLGKMRKFLGVCVLSDEIRPTAKATMEYFQEQGVAVKVISGDDPRTVSAIAEAVGVPQADAFIDASTLTSFEEIYHALQTHAVFGRVTPQQKRDIVRALHEDHLVVAMTGDGVNDVLALREADCSVAMASGSAAARNVSEIVLCDNDFASMPAIVAEGRRSINNLQRSASLFLVKTVFAALLALLCIIVPPYPFLPIQMSLISTALIGIPSFVLALEANKERVEGNFLMQVLQRSLPASLVITCVVSFTIILGNLYGLSTQEISTIATLLLSSVAGMLIVKISQPFNALRLGLCVSILCLLAGGFIWGGALFEFAPLSLPIMLLTALGMLFASVLFILLFDYMVHSGEKISWFAQLVRKMDGNDLS